jgi:pSer/pThr/pTyr-binding forkhead associated (FHA) protein
MPYSVIVIYKVTKCELCQQLLPDSVKAQGQKFRIYDYFSGVPAFDHYVVMEVLGTQHTRSFQIIFFDKKRALSIGRGHESDIQIADISVSRKHSLISYLPEKDHIILQDTNSKFGTLTLLQAPLKLKPG